MNGADINPKTTLKDDNDEIVSDGFPYFNNKAYDQEIFTNTDHDFVLMRNVPIKTVKLANGKQVKVATVFDLMMAIVLIKD